MDALVLSILCQDGIVNGAVYALSAMALVLMFNVTRVIFIPQGELIAFGALTLVSIEAGAVPLTAFFSVVLGVLAFVVTIWWDRKTIRFSGMCRLLAGTVLTPLAVWLCCYLIIPLHPVYIVRITLALAVVTPMGPALYRIAFRPLAEQSVLVLLVAAVGLHLVLSGVGLLLFGPEGARSEAFSRMMWNVGGMSISGQALVIVALTAVSIAMLYLMFEMTMLGKSLRATAVNRLGARLVGISSDFSGCMAFALAAFISALSGILCSPITTIYYDTGFLIGLKGFVGAIVGALVSYPVAAAAAIGIGLLESLSSYWASPFKEIIVFTSIIPVLLWRSLKSPALEDE
jgi:branched-chain amino acid transport system permease protein